MIFNLCLWPQAASPHNLCSHGSDRVNSPWGFFSTNCLVRRTGLDGLFPDQHYVNTLWNTPSRPGGVALIEPWSCHSEGYTNQDGLVFTFYDSEGLHVCIQACACNTCVCVHMCMRACKCTLACAYVYVRVVLLLSKPIF